MATISNTTIDYYVHSISPFSYLGHDTVCAIADRHGATLAIRPVDLREVFAAAGALALKDRSEARKRYRLVELQRIAAHRGLPITLQPAHFPTDGSLADRATIALGATSEAARRFLGEIFSAIWAKDRDIADVETLRTILDGMGEDAAEVLRRAETAEIADVRASNTADAIAAGCLGAPCYVLNGELFFGQDRLAELEKALETGRPPITIPG